MEKSRIDENKYFLDLANAHASMNSTCKKVQVGSVIVKGISLGSEKVRKILAAGSNHGIEHNCKETECLRVLTYGEDSKSHRLPSDCAALHSEIDALSTCARRGKSVKDCSIYITRYPCEACARAIAMSGINRVVYGRKQTISDMTDNILKAKGIEIVHVTDWEEEDRCD